MWAEAQTLQSLHRAVAGQEVPSPVPALSAVSSPPPAPSAAAAAPPSVCSWSQTPLCLLPGLYPASTGYQSDPYPTKKKGGREKQHHSAPFYHALWLSGDGFFFFFLLCSSEHTAQPSPAHKSYHECIVEDTGMNNRCWSPLSSHYINPPTFC